MSEISVAGKRSSVLLDWNAIWLGMPAGRANGVSVRANRESSLSIDADSHRMPMYHKRVVIVLKAGQADVSKADVSTHKLRS